MIEGYDQEQKPSYHVGQTDFKTHPVSVSPARNESTSPTLKVSQNTSEFVGLGLFQFARLIDIDPQSNRLNLPDWSGKPSSSPEKPAPKSPYSNNAHCHRRIIECLIRHRIRRREAKYNGDKTDPEDGHNPHGLGGHSEIKWSSLEITGIN